MQYMKFVLLTAATLALTVSSAVAAPIVCGNTGALANGTGSGSVTCNLDAGVGFTITSISLTRTADANTILSLSPNPVVTFTWNTPTGTGAGAGSLVYTLTGNGLLGGTFSASPAPPTPVVFAGPGTQTTSFDVGFTSSVVGGTLTSSSGVVIVDFVATPDQTGVPEPSTFALLGSALVGLGLLSRRRS